MGDIAGRNGRYANYDRRSAASGSSGGGLIQDGFDQPIFDGLLVGVSSGRFPRDNALNPFRVDLPGTTPGNTLIVDCSIAGTGSGDGTYVFTAFPVVSFNGGVSFFRIVNATMRTTGGIGVPFQGRSFACVTIGGGSVRVEMAYAVTGVSIFLTGMEATQSLTLASSTLSAAEHSTTSQIGPSQLVAFP